MGLRCLLGHDFDEPELQREREEDGNEVVTTVTEVKTCARCGETQIVSENTEVTTMEQLTGEATTAGADAADAGETGGRRDGAEAGTDGATADAPESFATGTNAAPDDVDAGARSDPTAEADATADGDDAVILDDGPGEGDQSSGRSDATPERHGTGEDGGGELLDEGVSNASTDAEVGSNSAVGGDEASPGDRRNAPTGDEQSAETDDGVILDETDEPADDRERGAWPEVEDGETSETEPTPWPEQTGDDEGYGAEVDGSEDSGDVEFGGGLTPEAAEEAAVDDAEYVAAPSRDSAAETGGVDTETEGDEDGGVGVGITRGESPDIGPSTTDVAVEYYCPECEMVRDASGNSMRAGDICPECKRGYVTERPIED